MPSTCRNFVLKTIDFAILYSFQQASPLMVAPLEAVLSIDADGQSASVKAVTTYEIYMEEYV